MTTLRDHQARRRARMLLDRNIVVEAGAGAGKTTLLTERLLSCLLAGGPDRSGAPLSRVVALTFTEKAAGEIKLRLASRLAGLLAFLDGRAQDAPRRAAAQSWVEEARASFSKTPEQVRGMAEEALQGLDRAPIGTIHHFCSTLLRLYPLEASVDPSFEVDPGEAFDELFDAEWALWLDAELGDDPPRGGDWLEALRGIPLEDLASLARALAREGCRQGKVGTTPSMERRIAGLSERFAEIAAGKPDPGGGSKILAGIEEVSVRLRELREGFLPPFPLPDELRAPGGLKERAWPKKWEALPGADIYREGAGLASATSGLSEKLLRRAAALVLPFADAFREKYARLGFVGYDGLLTRARDLVRDRPEVRTELKRRFSALLIDEFQDTDPLQGELLLYLAEREDHCASDWRQVRPAPGKLFVVGDPKQSIYRFRGADIRAYGRFTALLLEQGAEKCDLQTSFRSHEGITAPINAVFAGLMSGREGLQPDYLPLFPRPAQTRGEPGPGVELVLLQGVDGERARLPASRRQEAEARWIAGWIRSSRLPCKDVAVLLRTTAAMGALLEALKEEGIPYVVEADRAFYTAQEVLDFVNLLRVLDDPSDKISWAGLLRSPLVGLEDRELCALAEAGVLAPEGGISGELQGLSEPGRRRLESFLARVGGLRRHVGREPLGDFIGRVLRETFLLELCSAAYYREQTASNLLKFARLAAEAGEARGATLKEFIARALRSMEDSAREGESPLADEHLDAVRILTIHKAKGLEYPVVLLPGLTAKKGGGRDKPEIRVDWSEGTVGLRLKKARAADAAMALIEREEALREEHEAVRLLYVAMTRAKEKLILIGAARPGDKSSFSALLARAGAWPVGGSARPELVLEGGARIPVTVAAAEPGRVAGARGRPRGAGGPAWDAPAMALAWKAREAERKEFEAAPVFTTPTDASGERDKSSFPIEEGEPAPEEPALIGRVCHRVLERWDFQKKGNVRAPLREACAALAREHPEARWGDVSRRASDILEAFLASPAAMELASCDILAREVPFICERGGRVLRGAIDLLYRKSGKLWIADYKTDRVEAGELASRAALYAEQGRAYAWAVEKALGERAAFQVIFLRAGRSAVVEP